MKTNESNIDRAIRFILGAGLLAYGVTGLRGHLTGIVADVIGAVLILTAATGFCALYKVFGISTRKSTNSKLQTIKQ